MKEITTEIRKHQPKRGTWYSVHLCGTQIHVSQYEYNCVNFRDTLERVLVRKAGLKVKRIGEPEQ